MAGFSLTDGVRALGVAAWIAAGALVGTGVGLALFLRADDADVANSAIEMGDRLFSVGLAAVGLGAALLLVRVVTRSAARLAA